VRTKSEETTLSRRLLIPGYEPSIDALLNDPIAEAIMRYDRITREDIHRVLNQVRLRAVSPKGPLEAATSLYRDRRICEFQAERCGPP